MMLAKPIRYLVVDEISRAVLVEISASGADEAMAVMKSLRFNFGQAPALYVRCGNNS